MTREEALDILTDNRVFTHACESTEEEQGQALDIAIKALEQEPTLDKIRVEIDNLTYYWCEIHPRSVIDDVLEIIDKYRAESEDKE